VQQKIKLLRKNHSGAAAAFKVDDHKKGGMRPAVLTNRTVQVQ
jgi:hypothetical protein